MRTYSVYGTTLGSSIHLSDLTPISGPPEWRFERGRVADQEKDEIGREELEPGVMVRVFRLAHGIRVERTWLGTVDVDLGRKTIVWQAGEHDCEDCIGSLMIGRVLPLALFYSGIFTLHGSAVAVDEEGIAFVAPKHTGKSTLASALVEAGARLASDDCVPIVPEGAGMMQPGVSQLRLWSDSASNFRSGTLRVAGMFAGKHVFRRPAQERVVASPVPLRAIYVLERSDTPAPLSVVQRRRLPPSRALMSLIEHSKVGALVGQDDQAQLMGQAAALAAMIPVYTLSLAHDFTRLPEAVRTLLAWHDVAEHIEALA